MAFRRVDIQVIGAQTLRNRLRAIRNLPATVAKDPRIAETMIERTKRRFTTKKDPDGRRWKSLSRLFFHRRSNQDRSDILSDTGKLERSIGLTGKFGTATGLGFRIGITDPSQVGKGATHQLGGRSPLTGGPIPARPYLGVSREDATIVERLLVRIANEQGL